MTAIITNNTRVFNANQFVNAFQQTNYPEWTTATAYSEGEIVYYSNNRYIATTNGTSGATPPTHISGSASDGGVTWLHIESFISTSFFKNNLYASIGKTDEWYALTTTTWADSTAYSVDDRVVSAGIYYICLVAHTGDGAGNNDPAIDSTNWKLTSWVDSVSYVVGDIVESGTDYYECLVAHTGDGLGNNEPSTDATNWKIITNETPIDPTNEDGVFYGYLTDIISAKRLESNSVNLGIVRYNWTSGTIYSPYDPETEDFAYATPWYVITDENHIYKCIDNAGGVASTSKPTGTDIDLTFTADGYTWKYMATVSAADAITFMTNSYAPVDYKTGDDGSIQWDVQQNASALSISSIVVGEPGSGATSVTVTIGAPDQAGGIQATASAVLNAGVITAIQITNPGSGYTYAPSVSFTHDGTGSEPTATAVLAPKDGHGANVLKELDARYVIVGVRLEDDEGGYFPVTGENDFRQISILVDPLDDADNPCTALRYLGPEHPDYVSNPNTLEKLKVGSGTLLYTETLSPVIRTTGQIQDIKIVLKF